MTASIRWLNAQTPIEVGTSRGPGRPPVPSRGFSQVQLDTLRFWFDFAAEHGYPPTMRQVATGQGVTSNAINLRVRLLVLKGAMRIDVRNQARSAMLTGLGHRLIGAALPANSKARIVAVTPEKRCPCGTIHFLRETLRCAECQRLGRFPDADRDAVEKVSEL